MRVAGGGRWCGCGDSAGPTEIDGPDPKTMARPFATRADAWQSWKKHDGPNHSILLRTESASWWMWASGRLATTSSRLGWEVSSTRMRTRSCGPFHHCCGSGSGVMGNRASEVVHLRRESAFLNVRCRLISGAWNAPQGTKCDETWVVVLIDVPGQLLHRLLSEGRNDDGMEEAKMKRGGCCVLDV